MCSSSKGQTIEEIVASHSAGMTDKQKAEYWYELNQSIFALLGKVDAARTEITPTVFINTAQGQYPTLGDIKIADFKFFVLDLASIQTILTRDWTNLVKYVSEVSDCDKYATRLYSHFCDYYQVNSVVPVWGTTDSGYHGFNLAVLRDGASYIARLIEPQSDKIFTEDGPLGKYVPQTLAIELGILKVGA